MFEYVASGTSYFKLMYKESLLPQNLEWFSNTFGSLNGQHRHKISLLYNAYTEKRPGEWCGSHYRSLVHNIHADSGGLQMVTLGHTITNELKEAVYASQAKNSDVAMCFDVIPVRTLDNGRSERLDLSNRRFDRAMLQDAARETGRNLRRQIEFFLEKGTVARPMLITQGNDYDSYMQWVEGVKQELPQEYIKHIGGIAMGAAALGKGSLEDIKRAFYFTQLPIDLESRHLHLLGVGSVYRMLPQMIFIQNGMYEGVNLSYDSTTHTSGVTQGRYYMNDTTYTYTDAKRAYVDAYRIITEDIQKNFPFYEYTPMDLFHALNMSSRTFEEKFGNIDPNLQMIVAYVASSVKNFIEHVDRVSQSRTEVMKLAKRLDKNAFDALYSVKSTADFNHWLNQVGRYVDSEPVLEYEEQNSLEALFA